MRLFSVEEGGRRKWPAHLKSLKVHGQEFLPTTYALARMNAYLHGMENTQFAVGDTMLNPAFKDDDTHLERFDLIVANPMWNQKFVPTTYTKDKYERFGYGAAPGASADWGWIQHMLSSLKEGGRMAVVLDTGSVSRGSGNSGESKERDIRAAVARADLIKAVILLPENLFFNTSAPGVVLVLNRAKRHPKEVLLVNALRLFTKGRPKNELLEEHIETVAIGALKRA